MIERMTHSHTYTFSLDSRVRKHRIYTKNDDSNDDDDDDGGENLK
jgi:hypothetical protein